MKTYYLPLIIIPITLALSACGSVMAPKTKQAATATPQTSLAQGSGGPLTGTLDEPYSCPDTANVLPDFDFSRDGSGQFTVCQNREKKEAIAVYGQTAFADTICIFPAEYINERQIFWKPNLQTGGPLSQCIDVSAEGVFAEFTGINFNAVFIVDSPDMLQMTSCLLSGNYFACPAYSYGRFR